MTEERLFALGTLLRHPAGVSAAWEERIQLELETILCECRDVPIECFWDITHSTAIQLLARAEEMGATLWK